MSVIGGLSNLLGTNEPALRLLLTILAGYPISYIYNKYVKLKYPIDILHTYFCLTGLILYYFNYGYDLIHNLICCLITYLICWIFKLKPNLIYIISFIFNFSYLLIAYYYTESENDYDIKWTMPHCVLVLRLIGFSFDIADGNQDLNKLENYQKESNIKELPKFLELLAFSNFPSSFLVGPQFSFKRYQLFINGEYDCYLTKRQGIIAGERFAMGIFYLIIKQIGSIIIPDDYLLSEEFNLLILPKKIIIVGVWGKLALYKYIICWLLTEGSLINYGITYSGKLNDSTSSSIANKENLQSKLNNENENYNNWNACTNVKLKLYEYAIVMENYVQSFNVNTNQWVAKYVYKRLKFLNNRTISYGASLTFLAVWHGFHSGYYMAFLLEYSIITMEKQFKLVWLKLIEPIILIKFNLNNNNTIWCIIKNSLLKFYTFCFMGYCMIPFVYMSYTKWLKIFSYVYFYTGILLVLWFALYFGILVNKLKKLKNINKDDAQGISVSGADKKSN